MRGFQLAATRLALLRDEVRRARDTNPVEADRIAGEEQGLLAEIGAYRAAYVGRDSQVPAARWDGSGYLVAFPDGEWRPVAAPAEPVMPVPIVLAAPPPSPPPAGPPPPSPPPYPSVYR
jgi:hypothetical protein